MSDIQSQISARIDSFVADITELAKQVAYETLSSALEQGLTAAGEGRRGVKVAVATAARRRKGGKRSPEEIAETAEFLLEYIQQNPGERMETIAKAMGSSTKELTLPIKKLLSANQVHVEGQKRATTYFAAEVSSGGGTGRGRGRGRRRGRRRKVA